MINNIVFDLGNVLLIYDQYSILRNYLTDEQEIQIFSKEVFQSIEWKDCDRGIGNKETVLLPVLKRLPVKLAELCKKICFAPDFEIKHFPPAIGIEDIVKELKNNGYGIYLLSNVGLSFHNFKNEVSVLKYFDGCFASCDYGLLKPEPEIFNEFYSKFSLKPEECLFIDDTYENVVASQQSGMKAICYNSQCKNPQKLRSLLLAQGINISN